MFNTSDKNILNFHSVSFASGVIYIAIEHGLFEAIGRDGRSCSEIVQELKLPERSVNVMLSATMYFNLVERIGNKYFLPANAQAFLLSDSETYLGDWLLVSSQDERNRSMQTMREAIVNGKLRSTEDGNFDFLEHDVQEARRFARVMDCKSKPASVFWPELADLEDSRMLLDVGGGIGTHAYSACRYWSNLRAVIFEIPIMCKLADDNKPADEDLAKRVTTHSGDMWKDDYPQADVHFYSDIFHNWSVDKCRNLASKSYQALPVGGKIILHEMLYDVGRASPLNTLGYDVAMFIHTEEGQQYTENQCMDILASAGFQSFTTYNTFGDWSIISAVKG